MNRFLLVSSSSVPLFDSYSISLNFFCNAFILPFKVSGLVLQHVCVVVCECEGHVWPSEFAEQPGTQTMLREPLELRLRVRGMVWWRGMGESGGQNWWGWL